MAFRCGNTIIIRARAISRYCVNGNNVFRRKTNKQHFSAIIHLGKNLHFSAWSKTHFSRWKIHYSFAAPNSPRAKTRFLGEDNGNSRDNVGRFGVEATKANVLILCVWYRLYTQVLYFLNFINCVRNKSKSFHFYARNTSNFQNYGLLDIDDQ